MSYSSEPQPQSSSLLRKVADTTKITANVESITEAELTVDNFLLLHPKQVIGNNYEVIRLLKRDRSCGTYLVKDRQDREGSVLVLELINTQNSEEKKISEAVFLQQIALIKKISTHVQIPKLITHIIENQQYYVVYEYIRGANLATILHHRSLSESEIVNLIQDIARIYDFIVKANLVNFELLPKNILKSKFNQRYVLANLQCLFTIQPNDFPLTSSQQKVLFQEKLEAISKLVIQALIAHKSGHNISNSELQINWQQQINLSPQLQNILSKMVALNSSDRYDSFSQLTEDLKPLLKINQTIGKKYRLIRYLGSKGGIKTYLARDIQDSQSTDSSLLIVKQFSLTNSDFHINTTKIDNLQEEVTKIQQISFVQKQDLIRESFDNNEEFYLVRYYIQGVSLSRKLNQQKVFTPQQAIDLLKKSLTSLHLIHQQGLIHRNLKPSNLIFSEDNEIVFFVDFGILQTIQETQKNTNQKYTQKRKPPEQIVGRPTISSDIYALGILIIESLTGLSIRELSLQLALTKKIWQEKLTDYPWFMTVIEKMICSDVEQRYQSPLEVLEDLVQVTKSNNKTVDNLAKNSIKPKNYGKKIVAIISGITLLGSLEFITPFIRPQYYIYQGKRELKQQPKLALKKFEKALEIAPKQASALQFKGDALMSLQEFTAALKAYEQATKIDPHNLASWRSQGQIFYHLGDLKQALISYDRALEIDDQDVISLNRKGKILYLSSRYQEALSYQETALENEKTANIFLLSDIAHTSMALGKNNQALTVLNRVQSIAPLKPYLWQDKVIVLHQLERSEEALESARLVLESYEQALAEKPQNLALWLGKGAFLTQIQRYEQALTTYEKAIAIKPDSETAWLGKSEVFLKMERYTEALTAVEKAIVIKPQSFIAWHTRGLILQEEANLEQAVAAYDRAIAINRDFFPSWRDRSTVLIAQNNYPQAVESLQQAVTLAPQDVESWLNLTNALQSMQKIEEAIQAIDRLIFLQPRNSNYWLKKGSLWEKQQQYTKACDIYRQAMEIAPNWKITGAMQKVGCRS